MTDIYSKEKRSWVMSKVSGNNTKPEIIVRRLIHSMGFRYRLHYKKLPGKPDIVFPKKKKVIFVHGCFWHGHEGCKKSKRPTSNSDFWNKKIEQTIIRDNKLIFELKNLGWSVLIIWECQIKDLEKLKHTLFTFIT
jgi:DNA mismatch endonuclease (patch repair protein)